MIESMTLKSIESENIKMKSLFAYSMLIFFVDVTLCLLEKHYTKQTALELKCLNSVWIVG